MQKGRFEFGRNWSNFASDLSDGQIRVAEESLVEMLGSDTLRGASFLDIGCGSGLFSLAARNLGARRVVSFDYDEHSVETARNIKERFRPEDAHWTIERGDIRDDEYVSDLGTFDIVYSWGVLHHTGDLEQAMENVLTPLKTGSFLYLAIYNYVPKISEIYWHLKKRYAEGTRLTKGILATSYIGFKLARNLAADLVQLRDPTERYRRYENNRGMSKWHDWIDWIGGYPYDYRRPEAVFEFYKERGLELETLRTVQSQGNNKFLFRVPEDWKLDASEQ